jgi:hypothetical protein
VRVFLVARPLIAILIVAVVSAGIAQPVGAYPGAPWFEPGQPYDQNFPDPAIIVVDGTYYAYSTSTGGQSLPVMTSPDLGTWTARGDALGVGPSWSPTSGGDHSIWAPTVVELPTGDFLAAFAVETGTGTRRCITTALASSPLGPFNDASAGPFVCEPDPNGALDPFLIVDDRNVPWLIWKNEGVPVGHPTLASRRTGFWSRELTDDGSGWRPGSAKKFLIETTEMVRPWQGTLIENPAMVAWDGSFLLTYSANQYNSTAYATGWARCATPGGPCVEPSVHPLLTSNGDRLGPGGPAPFADTDGVLQLGYHGWNPPYTNYPSHPSCDTDFDGECLEAQRYLFIDSICLSGSDAFVYVPHGGAFCDVAAGTYYTDAVDWLAANGITTGISASAYGSTGTVSRAQMATFLWRLTGEPVGQPSTPFIDVDAGRFYTDAVAWLSDEGITTGTSPTRFGPDDPVSRGQMATFLWRLVGQPAAPASTPFTDVSDGQFFTEAVAWLADVGVTTGVSPTRFEPDGVVNRAQMAAFLCRLSTTVEYSTSGAPTPPC